MNLDFLNVLCISNRFQRTTVGQCYSLDYPVSRRVIDHACFVSVFSESWDFQWNIVYNVSYQKY